MTLEVSGNIDIIGSIQNILNIGTIMLYCGTEEIPNGWEIVDIDDKFPICCNDFTEMDTSLNNTQIEIINVPAHKHKFDARLDISTHVHTVLSKSHEHTTKVLKRTNKLDSDDLVQMNNNWKQGKQLYMFSDDTLTKGTTTHRIFDEADEHGHDTYQNDNHSHTLKITLNDTVESDNKEKVDIIPYHMKLLYIRYIG